VDLDPKILQRPAVIRPDSAANLEHNRSSKEEENLRFVISRHETPAISLLRNYYQKILLDSRNHIEVSLEAVQIYEELTNRLERDGGMSLIIDYGHEGTKEDTFRAFRRHTLHDPLANPGTADLTADVDFSMIRKICEEKSLTCGPITQRQLLSRVGIDLRLKVTSISIDQTFSIVSIS
jgi:NADH dehydrogenase [ubiquinone] 1 alpha subcomplex assembly factor 7